MTSTAAPALVLVAEDDPDLRALVEVVLQSAGYRAVTVASGAAALETATTELPCLMVLDVMMPGLSGLEVCRAVRARASTAGCPILLMSSHTAPDDVAAGLAAGADDYLPKPFSPTELLRRVRRLLPTAA
jgi:DNA-binding response OmpR family regulator